MYQKDFADQMRVNQSTVSRWKSRGWLSLNPDGTIDIEASRALLLEKRGTLGRIDSTAASKRSGWSKAPHCETHRAFALQRAWREAQ